MNIICVFVFFWCEAVCLWAMVYRELCYGDGCHIFCFNHRLLCDKALRVYPLNFICCCPPTNTLGLFHSFLFYSLLLQDMPLLLLPHQLWGVESGHKGSQPLFHLVLILSKCCLRMRFIRVTRLLKLRHPWLISIFICWITMQHLSLTQIKKIVISLYIILNLIIKLNHACSQASTHDKQRRKKKKCTETDRFKQKTRTII